MPVTDSQLAIGVLLVLLVWARIDAWRERRRANEYRRALNSMAIIVKETRKDG